MLVPATESARRGGKFPVRCHNSLDANHAILQDTRLFPLPPHPFDSTVPSGRTSLPYPSPVAPTGQRLRFVTHSPQLL
jgi:hypothetical protein